MDESTSVTIDKAQGASIGATDVSLPNKVLENLYQNYSTKQKRPGLRCFLIASILFDVWALLKSERQSWESIGITCTFLILNTSLAVFLRVCGRSRFRGLIWEVAPHLAWIFADLQLLLQLFFKDSVTPRDSLGWAVLLNFLVYVALPVPLKYTGILLGFGSFTSYLYTVIGLAKKENYFWDQQAANATLMMTAIIIGLLCYYLGEAKQRRAFLEAKQSLEVKMVIEEQSAEQERLLLSVLPEHVAVKMRQDLGSTKAEQFKKIYMSRHENVSILYADIVGFTAISSTYSAQDLVKMLNELFARFDRLAEKYQQLRIKILGDCYYCISGAPIERPDHAVLCVHMGLSMVKAIKYVQQKTNSPVDMRVGIHTGAVLAGILGQRQWQFDVYSKDVELANKMESSGLAGRVHISEKTLGFLNGEFEVEPALGEKREEALRIAGLKTYFITKVIQPFVAMPSEHKNGIAKGDTANAAQIDPDGPSDFRDDDEPKCASPADEETNIGYDKQKEEDYKMRLRKELVSRDGHGELTKDTNHFLTFQNKAHEMAYSAHREPLSSIPLIASLLVHIVGGIYSFFVLPRTVVHVGIFLLPACLISFLVVISIAESFPVLMPTGVATLSRKFNDCICFRRSAAVLTILIISFANIADMISSSKIDVIAHEADRKLNDTAMNVGIVGTSVTFLGGEQLRQPTVCLFPSYYSNYAVLILISISVVAQLSHIAKIVLMSVITVMHCYMNIYELEDQFSNEEFYAWNTYISHGYSVSTLLVAVTIALAFLARHMDKEDRVIFMWKTEVSEQKEKASDMRQRNEALIYNVLPVHVAEHFMCNRKRSYDELYSQSYAEVGVLFASMPNFSDFYSEETVNNQGLECLRFLNEVISDFDALLELPQFQDVIKIKTIGSTYMAASGLNPQRSIKADDPVNIRWAHLALLVEFALELKKALHSINEQSFNHFVLKMGINHGPITAGVIGARKPHYDIWGNTVNVASRMESTGKAGAIQVTEETCEILQPFGYTFTQRGLVAVKGKGQLMTYYLQGKKSQPSPLMRQSVMETLPEIDEPPPNVAAQQTSIADHGDSPLPGITSLSSSSASPNSVRINQDYLLRQVDAQIGGESNLNGVDNGKCGGVTNGIGTTTVTGCADDEADVKTPLLNDQNSSNVNVNDFRISEKDTLLSSQEPN